MEQAFEAGERVGITYEIRGVVDGDEECKVYEATDLVLRRGVLLKMTDREHRARVVREAQVLAAVRHPCVPAVYGLGVHRGLAYMATERVDGVTLAACIAERHRMPVWFHVPELIPLLTSFADALAAVHGVKLAHGALGARTVLVCPSDRVVLLGVAASGEEARVSDVKAFGAIAYELLTGQRPTKGAVDAAAIRPDVPHVLADLVQQCLAGTASMAEVAAELHALPRRRPKR
jgi:serine/threonine protein kinase